MIPFSILTGLGRDRQNYLQRELTHLLGSPLPEFPLREDARCAEETAFQLQEIKNSKRQTEADCDALIASGPAGMSRSTEERIKSSGQSKIQARTLSAKHYALVLSALFTDTLSLGTIRTTPEQSEMVLNEADESRRAFQGKAQDKVYEPADTLPPAFILLLTRINLIR